MLDQQQPALAPQQRSKSHRWQVAVLLVLLLASAIVGFTVVMIVLGVALVLQLLYTLVRAHERLEAESHPPEALTSASVRERALRAGGGAYLATGPKGEWVAAPPQSAVLVLAGPRAGKTSCVVIPALIAHPGGRHLDQARGACRHPRRAPSARRGLVLRPLGPRNPARLSGAALVTGAARVGLAAGAADRRGDDRRRRAGVRRGALARARLGVDRLRPARRGALGSGDARALRLDPAPRLRRAAGRT